MKPPLSARASAAWQFALSARHSSDPDTRHLAQRQLAQFRNDSNPRIRAIARPGAAREAEVLDQDGGLVG